MGEKNFFRDQAKKIFASRQIFLYGMFQPGAKFYTQFITLKNRIYSSSVTDTTLSTMCY